MDENKVQDILLQLLSDMAYVKAKLDNIDEQKLNSRIDALEAQSREHDRIIKSLENRNSSMEQYVRNNLIDNKKQNTTTWIGVGMAIFGAILSVIISLF
jgi:trehalose/maltose hydrolase-like predicted phosphorylase